MARILYLHGSQAGPFGAQTECLRRSGHDIVGRPRLPYPHHPRRSWRWLAAYFDQRWFHDAVAAAQQSYQDVRPDLIVAVSMGGAIAMNLRTADTPQVLVAPCWRAWFLLRFGEARQVKAETVVIHGDRDRTVFPRYSHHLRNGHLDAGQAESVRLVQERLAKRLVNEQNRYTLEGRLVRVHGEDHRCRGDAALQALRAAVDMLSEQATDAPAELQGQTLGLPTTSQVKPSWEPYTRF